MAWLSSSFSMIFFHTLLSGIYLEKNIFVKTWKEYGPSANYMFE